MKTREILELVVRIAGIYLAIKGLAFLGRGVVRLWDGRAGWELALLAGICYAAISIYFLRGAPFLLKWAFSEKSDRQPSETLKDSEPR